MNECEVSFSTLFQKNKIALFGFALKLTHDVNNAEDLVQETALRAYRSFHTFRRNSNFRSWSFTILRNLFIDSYNNNKKRALIDEDIEMVRFNLPSEFRVDNEAISNLEYENIVNCLEGLSSSLKTPLLLFTQGYKYEEIGERLNIPLGTVKSRINYARKNLKRLMHNQNKQAA
ncbi:RNA polymerase sigma-70 factor, ECF subfamily [Spirosomataceae bacterium TFI 002]|nr:RNA polymerase sigma-70 factor, ECF subfamily [Spirosomataceae bacterium TFI 002]